jgi:hypothetical protein
VRLMVAHDSCSRAPAKLHSLSRGQPGRGWGMMSSMPSSEHLNSRHRNTLTAIFQHPAGHNIEWHSVLSLLQAVATVTERHDGKYVVVLGTETEIFDVPRDKDIDAQQVVDLRRMLSNAGYGSEAGDSKVGT